MKSFTLMSAMLIGMAAATICEAADVPSPDIVQVATSVSIQAGSSAAFGKLLTTPSNKRLVIQTISFYTEGAASGSTTQLFLTPNIFNLLTAWASPLVYGGEGAFPAVTMQTTLYSGSQSNVTFDVYRTGNFADSEEVYVAISGYYVTRPQ